MRPALLLIPVLIGLAACATTAGQSTADAGSPLLSSLQVSVGDSAVNLVLRITNTTQSPIDLTYRSGQSYDFEIRQGGQQLWKWSSDRMFTQAVRNERLEAGASMTHEARWQPPASTRGTLLAIGRHTAVEHEIEQSTMFDFP